MTDTITRDGDIITIKSEVTRVIDLAQLRAELESLEAEPEPSDEELLSCAKLGMAHPYYDPQRVYRIQQLREEIDQWQKLSN